MVLEDLRIDEFLPKGLEGRDCALLVGPYQARVANNISDKYCCQAAFPDLTDTVDKVA
ncbi:MAG: hypothetical protein IH905_17765 [Proteobacteria bacterium]|nr:hypothetical protein [Pseudomonadota bacterium]